MIAYIDTSAVVKKYIKEHGSDELIQQWNSVETIAVSVVTYAEFFSALNRKKREGVVSEDQFEIAIQEFKEDWESFEKVDVNALLHPWIEKLTRTYPVRGFDAIHLASAVCFQLLQVETLTFLCADTRLNDAARQENLNVVDVS